MRCSSALRCSNSPAVNGLAISSICRHTASAGAFTATRVASSSFSAALSCAWMASAAWCDSASVNRACAAASISASRRSAVGMSTTTVRSGTTAVTM